MKLLRLLRANYERERHIEELESLNLRLEFKIMVGIADLLTKCDTIIADINAIPAPIPPVATQADLDALDFKLDTVDAAAKAKGTPGA